MADHLGWQLVRRLGVLASDRIGERRGTVAKARKYNSSALVMRSAEMVELIVSGVDYVEVSRTAHQLAADHGRHAYVDAAQLSQEAEAARKVDEAAFW